MTLTPVYGRDYTSASKAKQAFIDGQDFRINDLDKRGTYCSIRDFEEGDQVCIRYNKLRFICFYTI